MFCALWRWLFGAGPARDNFRNGSNLSLNLIRVHASQLIDAFESFAEQCFDNGNTEQLAEVQLLARFVGEQLVEKVGIPPIRDG